ncbi:MAG: Gfo/Idh/MocA family oxidoreductase [Lachnospiraceae bacterium]|jgi:glycerol-3-phosphate cytidylyltransferase|nr:Gfo/Idh/MocA family oxidoreductase [Lachnospiraceae bacterium]
MKRVITYGSFDLFHEGHYRLLKRAKALGNYLIVGVTTEHYDELRGKMNVVDSLMDRIENVRKTGFADEIIIEDHEGQKVEDIIKYGVDIFTVGSDWTGSFDFMKKYCEVVYLERTRDISSTMLRSKKYNIIRLGIIGTGRIAARMVPEVKYISGINVDAIYNPHIESAKRFAEQFEINRYMDDLEELYREIDAVYVASPHQTHYEYIKTAIGHHKHVLCEKPMVLKKWQAEELFQMAEDNKVILMEAIKTAYCPGFNQLLSIVRSGAIGNVCDVEACFTKLESPLNRELTDISYGGSFTELGSYTMLPILKILGENYRELEFKSQRADNGLDIYTKAYLTYDNGFGTAKNGLGVKSEGQLIISGTRGYIVVDAPWWKTTSFEVCYEDRSQNEKYFSKFLNDGLRYEIGDFVSGINGFGEKLLKLTRGESIALAEVMEKFLWEREDRTSSK